MVETKRKDGKLSSLKRVLNGFLYDGVERQDEKKIFGHISKAVWNVKMKKINKTKSI